jgi:hypothetical protein
MDQHGELKGNKVMPKTNDIKLGNRLKLMVVGINGSGKTRFWASFPGPIYVFDFDNRLSTVKKDYPNRTDIEYDTFGISNFKDVDKRLEKLQKSCPYATVVLDSITSATTAAVLYSLGETHGKTVANLSVPSFDEYVVETTVVTKFLEVFKELPCHIVITAHPIDRLDTKGKGKAVSITKVRSIVSYGSKLSSIIPNYLDEIYALQSGIDFDSKPIRFFYTTVDEENDQMAKTSLPLPTRLDWTGKDAFTVLKEALTEKSITLTDKPASNTISF